MNISTFSIYNINPNSVAETNTGFVPVTVTNLMLRNCNILTPSSSFMRELDPVSELVVEEHPHRVWASLHTSRLESLYTHGNEIKDFNVSKDLFAQIQGLTAFIITIGSPWSSEGGGSIPKDMDSADRDMDIDERLLCQTPDDMDSAVAVVD
ncbi:hypothetical protein L916_00473 [Phytophthora nicotianae]|nr:hypothetical protein L916_00473 [Phytophthora nicotianae]